MDKKIKSAQHKQGYQSTIIPPNHLALSSPHLLSELWLKEQPLVLDLEPPLKGRQRRELSF